jgi:hypothetical protein
VEAVAADGEILRAMIEGDFVNPSGCHPASDTPALFENADIGDRRQRSRDRKSRHPRANDCNFKCHVIVPMKVKRIRTDHRARSTTDSQRRRAGL